MSGLLRFAPISFVLASAAPALAADLPAPYVSRALDAVLIGVDDTVRAAFGLGADEAGVLVLAVAPEGVADMAGVVPGDVIGLAQGRVITDPVFLDEVVYYWLMQGTYDFGFDGWRAGQAASYATTITLESYTTVIDVTTVTTWTSYSYESFSYSEYTAEYSSEMIESYESAEAVIEDSVASEDFAADFAEEEATGADSADADEAAANGEEAVDDGVTQDAEEDTGAEEDIGAEEDTGAEEDMGAEEDTGADESMDEGDEGGDEGGEEIIEE